jgi:hypothetical protein
MINKFVFALASSSVLICNLIHAKPVEFWSMDKSKNEMQKNYAKEEGEILNLFARKNGEEESPINLKSGKSLRIEWKDPMPQSFTISFWVKVDSYYNRKLSTEISAAQKREAASQIICSKKDSFLIEMSYGKLRFSLWLKNKKKLKKITLKSDSRNMLRAQIWNHLSISYDKKYLKLYLNGNEIASKETDGKLMENLNPLIFGSNNPEDSFVGSIEKFKIFDRIYNFKAEELGFVSGKTLKGPSLLETKHINMEVSKNFIPRYFRDKGKRPLIDYISLCEGKKAQLYMDNIHWKSDWKLKHSTLISGKEP